MIQGKIDDVQNGKPIDLHLGRFTARFIKQSDSFTLSVQPSNVIEMPCPTCGK